MGQIPVSRVARRANALPQGKLWRRSTGSAGGEIDRSAPPQIPAGGWKDVLWRIYSQIYENQLLAMAAGVTFYGLLAIFPAIAALVAIYSLVADPATIRSHLKSLSCRAGH
jgi:membrane protein